MAPTKLAAATALLAIVLAACSGNTQQSASPTTSATSSKPTGTAFPTSSVSSTPINSLPSLDGCVEDGLNVATWNTLPDGGGPDHPITTGTVSDVVPKPGRCFDTVTFQLDTSDPVGYRAAYVPQVTQAGSGRVIPVDGGAEVQVSIKAPAADIAKFHNFTFTAGDDYQSLRQIVFAGSFEGVTTFGIGTASQTPLAVESHKDSAGKTQVVLYLAH
ncbi:hypothetical protein FOS14_18185 [Skermania sp. ID1734]|uniref:AMIN-like domain-containing (lipo)protein n=1 Tax=Skermania sp. ID1734 TaxID=2597516 RepID=UPI00117E551D|nr:hypothetical protein [Skermania sp. ID1734]TSD95292.1 hypothetical protein FOS14_18185 [Skermania sp. ID1734]